MSSSHLQVGVKADSILPNDSDLRCIPLNEHYCSPCLSCPHEHHLCAPSILFRHVLPSDSHDSRRSFWRHGWVGIIQYDKLVIVDLLSMIENSRCGTLMHVPNSWKEAHVSNKRLRCDWGLPRPCDSMVNLLIVDWSCTVIDDWWLTLPQITGCIASRALSAFLKPMPVIYPLCSTSHWSVSWWLILVFNDLSLDLFRLRAGVSSELRADGMWDLHRWKSERNNCAFGISYLIS